MIVSILMGRLATNSDILKPIDHDVQFLIGRLATEGSSASMGLGKVSIPHR